MFIGFANLPTCKVIKKSIPLLPLPDFLSRKYPIPLKKALHTTVIGDGQRPNKT